MSILCKIQKILETYRVGYSQGIAKIYCSDDTQLSVPSAPTNLVAIPGNSQVYLSWQQVEDGGSDIIDYKIEYTSNGFFWTEFDHVASTNQYIVVTGLTNDTLYGFRVSAINEIGTGPYSGTSPFVRTATVPDAPIITEVIRFGDNGTAIMVSWSEPYNNGSVITKYFVEYSNNSGASWTTIEIYGDNLSAIIDSLTIGDSYIFRVAAANSIGVGSFSPSSASIIPATTPSKPTAIDTMVQDSSLQIYWSEPNGGGLPISDYVIQYQEYGTANWNTFSDGVSTNTYTTITGLTNGITYLWRVAAVNSIGAGEYNDPIVSSYGKPGAIPGMPDNLNVEAGDESVVLSWSAPLTDGGYPIAGYKIEYSTDQGSSWIVALDDTDIFTSRTITNLINGTSYIFRIAAKNFIGDSDYSDNSDSVTPNRLASGINEDYCILFIDEAHPLYVVGTGNVGALWCSDVNYFNTVMPNKVHNNIIICDVDTPFVARGTYKGESISSDPFFIYPTGVNSSNIESCYVPIPLENITGIARPSGGTEYSDIYTGRALGTISTETFATGIVDIIEKIWGENFWQQMKDSYNSTYNRPCKLWIAMGHKSSLGSGVLNSGVNTFQDYTVSAQNWTEDQSAIYVNTCGERYWGWITDCLYSQGDNASCSNMSSVPNVVDNNDGGNGERLVKFYFGNLCSSTVDDYIDGNPFYEGLSLKIHPLFSCTGVYSSVMQESFSGPSNNNLLARWHYRSDPNYMGQNPYNRETQPIVGEGEIYLNYFNQIPYVIISGNCYDDTYISPSNVTPGAFTIWQTPVSLDIYGIPSGVVEEDNPVVSGSAHLGGIGIPQGECIPPFPPISFVSYPTGISVIDSCGCMSINPNP